MKGWKRVVAVGLCAVAAFSTAACADMGVGEHETSFYDYFSRVYMFSDRSLKKRKIAAFNASIETGAEEMQTVVPAEKYCYIAFRVDKSYTLEIEEFACHAKTEKETERLELDFYVTATMPTTVEVDLGSLKFPSLTDDDSGTLADEEDVIPELPSPEEGEGSAAEGSSAEESSLEESSAEEEEERTESDLFSESLKFASTSMQISPTWDSTLLTFDKPQTVKPREYIVLRVRNNCIITDSPLTPVAFTVNYLMFRFTKVEKK